MNSLNYHLAEMAGLPNPPDDNFKMDLDHVARLLGDTQKTISSRYLHPTAEMLQDLMNKASGW